jgi:hypothetical protein
MKIDLEEDMLFVGPKYSAPIVEASDGWIIASSTAINLLSEYGPPLESPFVENWAFDRSTGQFWHSTFSFECDAADIPCSDGGFHFFDTYTGWCASRF